MLALCCNCCNCCGCVDKVAILACSRSVREKNRPRVKLTMGCSGDDVVSNDDNSEKILMGSGNVNRNNTGGIVN